MKAIVKFIQDQVQQHQSNEDWNGAIFHGLRHYFPLRTNFEDIQNPQYSIPEQNINNIVPATDRFGNPNKVFEVQEGFKHVKASAALCQDLKDFTITVWFYKNVYDDDRYILCTYSDRHNNDLLISPDHIYFRNEKYNFDNQYEENTWYHLAITRLLRPVYLKFIQMASQIIQILKNLKEDHSTKKQLNRHQLNTHKKTQKIETPGTQTNLIGSNSNPLKSNGENFDKIICSNMVQFTQNKESQQNLQQQLEYKQAKIEGILNKQSCEGMSKQSQKMNNLLINSEQDVQTQSNLDALRD